MKTATSVLTINAMTQLQVMDQKMFLQEHFDQRVTLARWCSWNWDGGSKSLEKSGAGSVPRKDAKTPELAIWIVFDRRHRLQPFPAMQILGDLNHCRTLKGSSPALGTGQFRLRND